MGAVKTRKASKAAKANTRSSKPRWKKRDSTELFDKQKMKIRIRKALKSGESDLIVLSSLIKMAEEGEDQPIGYDVWKFLNKRLGYEVTRAGVLGILKRLEKTGAVTIGKITRTGSNGLKREHKTYQTTDRIKKALRPIVDEALGYWAKTLGLLNKMDDILTDAFNADN